MGLGDGVGGKTLEIILGKSGLSGNSGSLSDIVGGTLTTATVPCDVAVIVTAAYPSGAPENVTFQ